MIQAITIAVTLATAPAVAPAPVHGFDPTSVEIIGPPSGPHWQAPGDSHEATQVLARDANGDIVGTLALWTDVDGLHVSADYGDTDGDGASEWSESVVNGSGELVSIESVGASPEEFEARAELLGELINELAYASPSVPYGWIECGGGTAAAAASCVAASVFCPVGMALAACACFPLLIDEFEDMSCP